MKKHFSTALRVAVALAGVAYIVWTLNWHDQLVIPAGVAPAGGEALAVRLLEKTPDAAVAVLPDGSRLEIPLEALGDDEHEVHLQDGVLTTLSQARVGLILIGLLLVGLVLPPQGLRWYILMRSQDVPSSLGRAFRLTMVGMFFNICMPGTTGGDVVKAFYAARSPGKRTRAIMSVIFDRAAGLVGLMLLAGAAGLLVLDNPLAATVTAAVWAALGVLLVGGLAYFTRAGRRWLGIDLLMRLVGRVEILGRIEQAVHAYRHSRRAVLAAVMISLPVHAVLALSCALAGYALDLDKPMGLLLVVLPVVFLAASVPISIQGLGIMEALTIALLLDPPSATQNQIVGMLLIYRLFVIFWALVGSLAMLGGEIHLHPTADPAEELAPASGAEGTAGSQTG